MTDVRPTRRRKSPTSAELATWRTYIEGADALRRALALGFQESCDVSPGDYEVLLALDEASDHRLRSSALAETVGWERSRLSHHLRRMEQRDLVTRTRLDDDARAAEIVLTEQGARSYRAASASHLRLVRELFVDALSTEELAMARTVADRLRAHLTNRGGAPAEG